MSAVELMELSGSSQLFDGAFHPSKDLLATALITGNIEVWKLPFDSSEVDEDESDVVMTLTHHRAACRGVKYLTDNTGSLLSISSDCSWALIDTTGQIVQQCHKAHDQAINKVCLVEENMFATGDDAGVVKLWDMRVNNICKNNSNNSKKANNNSAVLTWDAHTDFVSAMEFASVSKTLLSTAGDATLCVYDIRHAKNFYKSDDQEAELTSMCVLEDRKLVACGTDNGTLLLFKWGLWGDCSDRFTNLCGQSESVNTLSLMRDGHTILAGCGDGKVHACSLYPMRRLGVVGSMTEESTVEGVVLNNDGSKLLMASFAYTERMVLWDMTEIESQLTAMATAPARDSDDESDESDDCHQEEEQGSSSDDEVGDEDYDSKQQNSDDDDDDDVDKEEENEDSDDNVGEGDEDNEHEESDDNIDQRSNEINHDVKSNKKDAANSDKDNSLTGKKRFLEAESIVSSNVRINNEKKQKPTVSDKKDKEDANGGKKKEKRLKTDSERFYADL